MIFKKTHILKTSFVVFFLLYGMIALGDDDSLIVNQEVLSFCDNDGVCEVSQGETYLNCPTDCEAPVCNNNGICDAGETVDNCYADCYVAPQICNNNNVCESNLGEDSSNCPNDCYTVVGIGNGPPLDLIQKGLIGSPIQIKNLEISIGITGTNISWETNKPTISTLILSDGLRGSERVFLDKLFMNRHSLNVGILDPKIDHYFRIFAEGVYGDNNFGYVELYVIRKITSGSTLTEEENILQIDRLIDENDDFIIERQEECLLVEDKIVSDSCICGWSDFVNLLKNNKWIVFLFEFFWQILILIFILYTGYLLYKDSVNKNKKS